jgi:heme-degrading monooxygenase HmoA
MIARVWHGRTSPADAGTYESMLRSTILPGIHRVAGYEGAFLLRRDAGSEVEFVTITMFRSMEAVRAFAGPDYEKPVIHPEAERLLTRYDERSIHYEVVMEPEIASALRASR